MGAIPRQRFEVGGIAYECRIPTIADAWAVLGAMPGVGERAERADGRFGVEDALSALALSDALILRCVKSPTILAGSPAELPVGCYALDEIAVEDRFELSRLLRDAGGLSSKDGEQVGPLSATDPVS